MQNEKNGEILENSPKVLLKEKKGIVTIKVWDRGEKEGDNRGKILEYIVNNYTKDGLATVLGSGLLIDQMAMSREMKPKLGAIEVPRHFKGV